MVSIVIPTYNAIQHIELLINKLREQTLRHELIIIDSSSTDGTAEIAKHSGARFYQIIPSEFNHGRTRNMGLKLANNNIVGFLTQDALPVDTNSLEKLVYPLETIDGCVMAYGRQLPYPSASVLSQFARITNYPAQSRIKSFQDIDKLGIKTCHCSNSFAAYNKAELLRIGGFPTDTILGEDVTVAAKFIIEGQSLAYCAEAQVYHSHDYTICEESERYFDIGVFHHQQRAVLKPFTRAESEGLKYIRGEWQYLINQGYYGLLPEQFIRTAAKYFGYKLGRLHEHLPNRLKKKISMHRQFWEELTAE